MKNIVLSILMLISSLAYTQTDSTEKVYASLDKAKIDRFVCNMVINPVRTPIYYVPTMVDLRLSQINNRFDPENGKKVAMVFFISGLAFTTAALLEDPYSLDTFWQQTPRQIMFCVGVGFTLGGGVSLLRK